MVIAQGKAMHQEQILLPGKGCGRGDAVYQGNVRQVREAGEGMIKTEEEEGR